MELVDVFTINWGGDNDLWSPAVTLISRMIGHAEVSKAVGAVVVPCWPSATVWFILHPPIGRFADLVSEVEELPLSEWLILPGLSAASLFNGRRPNAKC